MIKRKIKYKNIDHNQVTASCLQALDANNRKTFFRKLNNILIEELDVDYSSFFFSAGNNLNIYESNIQSDVLKSELESIVTFADSDGEDFKRTFDDKEIIFIESNNVLIYPTAKRRNIRSAMCMPLDNSGYWLIEDSRKLGSDEFIQGLAQVSKNIERLIRLHSKDYLNESFNIPTYLSLYNECREIARSVIVLEIENLYVLLNQYGSEIRKDLIEIVIKSLQEENHLKGGIGIRNDDLLIVCSMRTVEQIQETLNQVVTKIEGFRLTIDSETVNLKLKVAIGTVSEFEEGIIEKNLRRAR